MLSPAACLILLTLIRYQREISVRRTASLTRLSRGKLLKILTSPDPKKRDTMEARGLIRLSEFESYPGEQDSLYIHLTSKGEEVAKRLQLQRARVYGRK